MATPTPADDKASTYSGLLKNAIANVTRIEIVVNDDGTKRELNGKLAGYDPRKGTLDITVGFAAQPIRGISFRDITSLNVPPDQDRGVILVVSGDEGQATLPPRPRPSKP